jgi:hypothetical protein
MTIENKDVEISQVQASKDLKAQMLVALAKKQKGQKIGKSLDPSSGSKVGAGQTVGTAPKMHRRKAGSA